MIENQYTFFKFNKEIYFIYFLFWTSFLKGFIYLINSVVLNFVGFMISFKLYNIIKFFSLFRNLFILLFLFLVKCSTNFYNVQFCSQASDLLSNFVFFNRGNPSEKCKFENYKHPKDDLFSLDTIFDKVS